MILRSRVPGSITRAAALIVVFVGLLSPAAAQAGRLPSRANDETAAARKADLATVQEVAARAEVRAALAARGLTPAETDRRLAQLSAEDLRMLAAHADQIQAAGRVPNYIWILLAILIAVTIVTTIA